MGQYEIVCSGELLVDFSKEQVQTNLMALFWLD